jgi:hypothetical protein
MTGRRTELVLEFDHGPLCPVERTGERTGGGVARRSLGYKASLVHKTPHE